MTTVAPARARPTATAVPAGTGQPGPHDPDRATSPTVTVLVDGDVAGRVAAARVLATRLARSTGVRAVVADGPVTDPYRLAARVPGVAGDAVVLVAPRRRGPRRLVPGPVVAGRPVAIVPADHPDDLPRVLPDPDRGAGWVVAAMAKNIFLEATEHWASSLTAGGRAVVDLRADRARRDDLVAGLAAGPAVVLYAGHGRARGWAGYQALRFHHLAGTGTPPPHTPPAAPGTPDAAPATIADPAVVRATAGAGPGPRVGRPGRAAGLVVAFACDTLGRPGGRRPFGVRLVEAGLARAYLAPASSVRIDDTRALADLVVALLATTRPRTAAELVVAVDRAVADQPGPRRAWRSFRLVGLPDTSIT